MSGYSTFNKVSGESARYALAQAHNLNFSSLPAALLQKSAPLGQFTLDSLLTHFRQPAVTAAEPIARVSGMPLAQAKTALEAADVQIAGTETYNPATFNQNLGDYLRAPADVPPGSSVTLIVDSTNTVRYYVPTTPAMQQLKTQMAASPSPQNIEAIHKLVTNLQKQVTHLQSRLDSVDTPKAKSKATKSRSPKSRRPKA